MPLLRVEHLSRVFQGVIKALDDVSLTIQRGEMVALLGPSGSGKSTLLSLIAGYDVPDSGRVLFNDLNIDAIPRQELLTKWVGVLFQQCYLLEHLSPLENIEIALLPTYADPRLRRRISAMLLDRVGLTTRATSAVRNLSGGERQRVAFCRSIANSPRLLLADEPTGNLDSRSKRSLLALMREYHCNQGGTLLVATHDSDVAGICRCVVHLRDGRRVSENEQANAAPQSHAGPTRRT